MKYLAVLLVLLAAVSASDRTECKAICQNHFKAEELTACDYGCYERRHMLKVVLGVVTCKAFCARKFNGTDSLVNACHFACSLPFTATVLMEVRHEGGQRKMQLYRQSGFGNSEPIPVDGSSSSSEDFSDEHYDQKLSPDITEELQKIKLPFVDMNENADPEEVFRKFVAQLNEQVAKVSPEFAQRPTGHNVPYRNTVYNFNNDGKPIITEYTKSYSPWGMQSLVFYGLLIGLACMISFAGLAILERCGCGYNRLAYLSEGARLPPHRNLVTKETKWAGEAPSGGAPPAYDELSTQSKNALVEQK